MMPASRDRVQETLRKQLPDFHLTGDFLRLYRRILKKRMNDYQRSLMEDDARSLELLMNKVNESRIKKGLRPLRRIQPRHLKAAKIEYWWIDE